MANNLLLERSKLFAKYAESMPQKADKLDLQLDYPDCGWIDMHFKVNGEEKIMITASYAYEPFEDIRDWLEQIVKHIFDFTPTGVKIYDEFDDYLLYYEPFFFHSDELLTKEPPQLDGLFYIYDSCEKKIVLDAVCETKMCVMSIYESILAFAKESSKCEDFIDDWIADAYNHELGEFDDVDDPRVKDIFVNKVTSPVVEEFINNKDSTTKYIPIK